jgi:vancomycin permeability regulator SanA
MKVQAFAANKVAAGRAKVTIREYFARSLAVWDLYFAGNGEKYSGKMETL